MIENVVVMDSIFNTLYNLYIEVLSDLNIGGQMSYEKIEQM